MTRLPCASGITDEDTVGVTDGGLGKNFPDRDLGFGWEEQDGLTAEMIRCDFWNQITLFTIYKLFPKTILRSSS